MSLSVAAQIKRLRGMTVAELQAEYERVVGKPTEQRCANRETSTKG